MSTLAADNVGSPTVLILGGWSPGPLIYLKRAFYGRCTFLEPTIPMPFVGFSWCHDGSIFLLLVVVALAIWACVAFADYINSRVWLAMARLAVVVLSLILSRLCVAAIVRGSISKGVNVATTCMQHHNVAVVIGFSWGGGVVAEMLRQGLVGGHRQPAVLLIAPTTALMASFAMKKDAPLTIRMADDMSERVHVFHGTGDEAFCPHYDRWGITGASFHLIHDNHVFCRQESVQEIADVLAALIRSNSPPPV